MRWKPVVVQSERSDGSLVVTVGHPLVDAYLEFLRARARPNTIRAVAFDLKVFFTFVDKTPARVTSADVMAFITAQRNGEVTARWCRSTGRRGCRRARSGGGCRRCRGSTRI